MFDYREMLTARAHCTVLHRTSCSAPGTVVKNGIYSAKFGIDSSFVESFCPTPKLGSPKPIQANS